MLEQVDIGHGANHRPVMATLNGLNQLTRHGAGTPAYDDDRGNCQTDNQGRRNWLHADERGSIVAVTDAAGAA